MTLENTLRKNISLFYEQTVILLIEIYDNILTIHWKIEIAIKRENYTNKPTWYIISISFRSLSSIY